MEKSKMDSRNCELILKSVKYKNKYMKRYLCRTDTEPCGNERILHNVSVTKKKVTECTHKINVVLECFDYELEHYKDKEMLTEEQAADYKTIKSLRWRLFCILKSFIDTRGFLCDIIDCCKQYRFPKGGLYEKAVARECKIHIKRCKDCFNNVVTEYIMSSMLRPYYIHLGKQGIKFIDDINKHFPVTKYENHEQAHDELKPYIQMIADFDPSCTSYKEYRKEEHERLTARYAAIEAAKKAEREQKQKILYEEKLEKIVSEIEDELPICKTGYNAGQHAFIRNIRKHPDYPNREHYGSVVCCLVKPEIGDAKVHYLTNNGLTTYRRDVDAFFFDNESLEKAIERCRSYPNVKAVNTISIFWSKKEE